MRNQTSLFAAYLFILTGCASGQTNQSSNVPDSKTVDLTKRSRETCVLVTATSSGHRGTGFWISGRHFVTCFHVVGNTAQNDSATPSGYHLLANFIPSNTTNILHVDLANTLIVDYEGETLGAEFISSELTGTNVDLAPFVFDFAILKVKSVPKNDHHPVLEFAPLGELLQVGEEVTFSGFPLGTPEGVGVVTLKGMVAGGGNGIWCIQSSVNKGNSGGAVLSAKGEVIGIMTQREGGISQQLNEVRAMLGKNGTSYLGGVNQEALQLELVNTLDTYISTGLGYARSIQYVRDYCHRHPALVR
jgi:hypothetical protein